MQVWFAHKPMRGPLKASFHVLPDLTPSESRILQSPSYLQTLPQRRAPGTSSVTIGEAIDRLECDYHLVPGTFLQVRARQTCGPRLQQLTTSQSLVRTCLA